MFKGTTWETERLYPGEGGGQWIWAKSEEGVLLSSVEQLLWRDTPVEVMEEVTGAAILETANLGGKVPSINCGFQQFENANFSCSLKA